MRKKILKTLDLFEKGFIDKIQTCDYIESLFDKDNKLPEWLNEEDWIFSVMLYREYKVEGIKYLLELARPYTDSPLTLANTLLSNYAHLVNVESYLNTSKGK